jgi:Zn-dependent protease
VLYALGDPLSFVLLVASFLIAVTLHGWVQCVVADRAGDRRPRLEGRLRPDPRRHVDPFGAVSALISGLGWARPVDIPPRGRRAAVLAVTLSGSAANLVVGLVCLVVFRVLAGAGLPAVSATLLQHGTGGGAFELRVTLLFGLMNVYIGLLSLVPLPPLDGGRLLFALAPRSSGWQKAEYHLVEQNIGVAVVLVLLLLPLGGPQALLPTVLDLIASPLVRLVTGG